MMIWLELVLFGKGEPVAMFLVEPLELGVSDGNVAANMQVHDSHEEELIANGLHMICIGDVEGTALPLHLFKRLLHFQVRHLDLFGLGFLQLQSPLDKLRQGHVFRRFQPLREIVPTVLAGKPLVLRFKLTLHIRQHDQFGIDDGDDAILQMGFGKGREPGRDTNKSNGHLNRTSRSDRSETRFMILSPDNASADHFTRNRSICGIESD